jgi:hypothetical protein
MADAVEELRHVQVDDPSVSETALPADPDRIQGRAARPVAVGIGVEDRLDLRLDPGGHDRLRDSVGDGRHSQYPYSPAVRLRYLHSLDRWREVAARGHPIPDLVQIVSQIFLENLERDPIHTRRTPIGLHLPIGLQHFPLRDIERLS